MRSSITSALLFAALCALAQDDSTFAQMLSDTSHPSRYGFRELPPTMKAVRMRSASEDEIRSMYALYGAGLSTGTMNRFNSVLSQMAGYISIFWTTGETKTVEGAKYLVGYRFDLTNIDPAIQQLSNAIVFDLTYVRLDHLDQVTPLAEMTPAEFVRRIEKVLPAETETQDRAATESNVNQLLKGLIMYANDNSDILPFAQSTRGAWKAILPYVKDKKVFSAVGPSNVLFRFNMNLAGVAMSSIETPAAVVAVYEEAAEPDGSRVVGYMDGHVRSVGAEHWPAVEKAMLAKKWLHKGKPLPKDYGSDF